MSVEGLLSEVPHFNAHTLEVTLGEQLHYGGKRVFSDVKPGSSSSGDCKKSGSELKEAVGCAKKNAEKAVGGCSQQGGNTAAVSKLEQDHSALVKKVDQLAGLVAELQLQISTLRNGQVGSVLILGDGNLSFSLAIARSDPRTRYFATVFDSRDEFLRKYRAEGTLEALGALENVILVFGVDATALPTRWANYFHTIIMNFPHPGGKTNLRKSKILLSGIFKSLHSIMSNDARFLLSLATGQSGIEKVTNPWIPTVPDHKRDSWQAIYLGAEQGFILDSVDVFDTEKFKSYKSSGYKETEKGFNNREGLTLAFKKCDNQQKTLEDFRRAECRGNDDFNYYRPFYTQDLSFLFKLGLENVDEGEKIALSLLKSLAGDCLAEIGEVESLRSICPDPPLPNRIYRVIWQGKQLPMGRETCARIHEELRCRIVKRIEEENLPIVLT